MKKKNDIAFALIMVIMISEYADSMGDRSQQGRPQRPTRQLNLSDTSTSNAIFMSTNEWIRSMLRRPSTSIPTESVRAPIGREERINTTPLTSESSPTRESIIVSSVTTSERRTKSATSTSRPKVQLRKGASSNIFSVMPPSIASKPKTSAKQQIFLGDIKEIENKRRILEPLVDNLDTAPEFRELQDVMIEVYREYNEALRFESGLRDLLHIEGEVNSESIAAGMKALQEEMKIIMPGLNIPSDKSKNIDVAIYNLKIIQHLASDPENLKGDTDSLYALQILFASCVQDIRRECLLHNIGSRADADALSEIAEDVPDEISEYRDTNWKKVLGVKEKTETEGLTAAQRMMLQMGWFNSDDADAEGTDHGIEAEASEDQRPQGQQEDPADIIEEDEKQEILIKAPLNEGLGKSKNMSIIEYIRQVNGAQSEGGSVRKGNNDEIRCNTLVSLMKNLLQNADKSAINGLCRVLHLRSSGSIQESAINELIRANRGDIQDTEKQTDIRRVIEEMRFLLNLPDLQRYIMGVGRNEDVIHLRNVLFRKYAIIIRDWCNNHIMSKTDEQAMREIVASINEPVVVTEGGIDYRDILVKEAGIVGVYNGCGFNGIWSVVKHQENLRKDHDANFRSVFSGIIPSEMSVEEFLGNFSESTRKLFEMVAMKPVVLGRIFNNPGVKFHKITNFTQLTRHLMGPLYNLLTPSLQKALVASSFGRVFDLRVFSELANFLAKDYLSAIAEMRTNREKCLARVISIMFSNDSDREAIREFLNVVDGQGSRLIDLEDEDSTFPRLSISKKIRGLEERVNLQAQLQEAEQELGQQQPIFDERYGAMLSYGDRDERVGILWQMACANIAYDNSQEVDWQRIKDNISRMLSTDRSNITGDIWTLSHDVVWAQDIDVEPIRTELAQNLRNLLETLECMEGLSERIHQIQQQLGAFPIMTEEEESLVSDWHAMIKRVNHYNDFVDALSEHIESTNVANSIQENILFSAERKESGAVDNQLTLSGQFMDEDDEVARRLVDEKGFLPNGDFVAKWRSLSGSNGIFALNYQNYRDVLMTCARRLALTPEWREARAIQIALSDPKGMEFVKELVHTPFVFTGSLREKVGDLSKVYDLLKVLLDSDKLNDISEYIRNRSLYISDAEVRRILASIGRKLVGLPSWKVIQKIKNMSNEERENAIRTIAFKPAPIPPQQPTFTQMWKQLRSPNSRPDHPDEHNLIEGAIRSILKIEDDIHQEVAEEDDPYRSTLQDNLRMAAAEKMSARLSGTASEQTQQDTTNEEEQQDKYIAEVLKIYATEIVHNSPEIYGDNIDQDWRRVPLKECLHALYYIMHDSANGNPLIHFLRTLNLPICRNRLNQSSQSLNWRDGRTEERLSGEEQHMVDSLLEQNTKYSHQEMVLDLLRDASQKEREFDYEHDDAEAVCLLNCMEWVQNGRPKLHPSGVPNLILREIIDLEEDDILDGPTEHLVRHGRERFNPSLLGQARNLLLTNPWLKNSLSKRMEKMRLEGQQLGAGVDNLIYFVPGIAMADTSLPTRHRMHPYTLLSRSGYNHLNPIARRRLMDFMYIASVEYMLRHMDELGRRSGQYAAFLDLQDSPDLQIGYTPTSRIEDGTWNVNSDNSKYSVHKVLESMPERTLVFTRSTVDENKIKYILRYYLLKAVYFLATNNLSFRTSTAFPPYPSDQSESVINNAFTAVNQALEHARDDWNVPQEWKTGVATSPYPHLATAMRQNGDSMEVRFWREAVDAFRDPGAFGGIRNMLSNIRTNVRFPNMTSAAISAIRLVKRVKDVEQAIASKDDRKINKSVTDISAFVGNSVSRFGHCGAGQDEGVFWFILNSLVQFLESNGKLFADLDTLIPFVCSVAVNNLLSNVFQFPYEEYSGHEDTEAAGKGSEAILSVNGFGNTASRDGGWIFSPLRFNIMRRIVGFFGGGSDAIGQTTMTWWRSDDRLPENINENLRNLISYLDTNDSDSINILINGLKMGELVKERLKAYCAVYRAIRHRGGNSNRTVMDNITKIAVNEKLLVSEVAELAGASLIRAFRTAFPKSSISKISVDTYNQLSPEDKEQVIFDILVNQGYITR